MRKSEASDPVRAYVARRLKRETEGPNGVPVARISEATGASAAHVSNVKNGKSGIGRSFEEAIARYWGMTVDELRRAAAADAEDHAAPPASQVMGGRLRDRPEWEEQLTMARQVYRTFSDEELVAVGECYDHMDLPVTAEFIGTMAQALRIRRNRGGGRGNPESESGPARRGSRAG